MRDDGLRLPAEEIVARLREGETLVALAASYGVTKQMIVECVHRCGLRVGDLRQPIPLDKLPTDPGERWRACPDHPNYAVSNNGRVARTGASRRAGTKPGNLIAPVDSGAAITVPISGARHTVAALVAAAFIGPRPGRAPVRHWDDDYRNNRPENLFYARGRPSRDTP